MAEGRIDRFELVKETDRDAVSVTYAAKDARLRRDVSLRLFQPPGDGRDPRRTDLARERFEAQIKAAAGLSHPGVPFLLESGEHRSHPFAVFETPPGLPLSERIEVDGPLPLHEAVALGRRMVDALCAAHEHGIYHGSLYVGDVMVTPTSGVSIVGLHEPAPDKPEGVQRLETADLKSAAKVLWAMLMGLSAPLPSGTESMDARRGVPPGLVRIITACLLGDRSPAPGVEVPASCHDLAALLDDAEHLDADAIPSADAGIDEPGSESPLAHWALAVGGVLIVASLLSQTWELGVLGAIASASALMVGERARAAALAGAGLVAAGAILLAALV